MKTITAKELRDNLDQIVKRARQGELIRVTYRSKAAFVIQPDNTKSSLLKPGSRAAMQDYVQRVRQINKITRKSELDPNKSIKEMYHLMLDKDMKYKNNHD